MTGESCWLRFSTDLVTRSGFERVLDTSRLVSPSLYRLLSGMGFDLVREHVLYMVVSSEVDNAESLLRELYRRYIAYHLEEDIDGKGLMEEYRALTSRLYPDCVEDKTPPTPTIGGWVDLNFIYNHFRDRSELVVVNGKKYLYLDLSKYGLNGSSIVLSTSRGLLTVSVPLDDTIIPFLSVNPRSYDMLSPEELDEMIYDIVSSKRLIIESLPSIIRRLEELGYRVSADKVRLGDGMDDVVVESRESLLGEKKVGDIVVFLNFIFMNPSYGFLDASISTQFDDDRESLVDSFSLLNTWGRVLLSSRFHNVVMYNDEIVFNSSNVLELIDLVEETVPLVLEEAGRRLHMVKTSREYRAVTSILEPHLLDSIGISLLGSSGSYMFPRDVELRVSESGLFVNGIPLGVLLSVERIPPPLDYNVVGEIIVYTLESLVREDGVYGNILVDGIPRDFLDHILTLILNTRYPYRSWMEYVKTLPSFVRGLDGTSRRMILSHYTTETLERLLERDPSIVQLLYSETCCNPVLFHVYDMVSSRMYSDYLDVKDVDTPYKVFLYYINPSNPRGKKLFLVMLEKGFHRVLYPVKASNIRDVLYLVKENSKDKLLKDFMIKKTLFKMDTIKYKNGVQEMEVPLYPEVLLRGGQ